MTMKRILTAKCPSCATTLQVKTRSLEKVVTCPKCQTMMTVTAPPEAGADAHDADTVVGFAAAQSSLPVAEPMPTAAPMSFAEPLLPSAEPLPFLELATPEAPVRRPAFVPLAIAGGAVCVLVGVALFLAFGTGGTPGPQGPFVFKDKPASNKPADGSKDGTIPPVVPPQDDDDQNKDGKKSSQPIQIEGSAAKQAAKVEFDFAAAAYSGADAAFRERKRWRLANEGRMKAMKTPLVPLDLDPIKLQYDQAKQAYDRAKFIYERTQ